MSLAQRAAVEYAGGGADNLELLLEHLMGNAQIFTK